MDTDDLMAATDDPGAELTRRGLLAGAVGMCAALAIGAGHVLLADDAQAADGITRLPDGRVKVQPNKIPALSVVGGVVRLGTVKGTPVGLVRTGATSFVALDLRCTHQGATVRQTGQTWSCPAHLSRFALNGRVTGGPAPRDLARVPMKRSGSSLTIG